MSGGWRAIYEPVKVGRMTLVDGGARSTTDLDLAAKAGCDLGIGVAPMAYDAADRRAPSANSSAACPPASWPARWPPPASR